MRVYADRIQVERGEEWTYDVYFQNRDGSPYIVSNQLTNPYILVTIASSKYTQNGRYIANFWNNVTEAYHTFYCTQPIELTGSTMPTPENGLSREIKLDIQAKNQTYSTYAVYKWVDPNGVAQYKYWNGTAYEDYDFHFVMTFPTDITNQWIEQNYVFGVKLVAGTANADYNPEVDGSRPIATFDGVQVLVAPMQLIVTSNIAGSLPLL